MAGESFDPYDLGTQGQNSFSPFTIGIQGQITDLDITIDEVIPEEIIRQQGPSGGGGSGRRIPKYLEKEKKLKRICVKIMIDGEEYEECIYSKDLTILSEDVKVKIVEENSRPKILIEILKQ